MMDEEHVMKKEQGIKGEQAVTDQREGLGMKGEGVMGQW